MPFKPLVTAGIESLLNTFLYRSPALKTARSRLLGKVLRVEVKGFSTSLILVFSERQVDVLGEWAGDADCTVIAYASVLPKLRDRQQLTALIRSGELEVQVSDTSVIDKVAALPFVTAVRKVWTAPDSIPARNANRKKEVTNRVTKSNNYYGDAWRQIAVHHGDSLHAAGFRGKGMQIAVIDAGFYNADEISVFKGMDLLGTRDFVNSHSDIYAENYHGMKVLSCMAANKPNVLVGTAPEASYWLLRSEDDDTEQPVEEDYWAEALEFADSVGVDVVNTSLGYYEFDDTTMNYRYRDLDGHYSLMSHSASLAADKGLVLVCSAGNSGRGTWKKITPPGDAENVITVGAADRNLVNADFSSVGNTTDGRVKPDVMAVGVASAVAGNDGTVSHANGTSFASPTLCGLVACFWQACPWLTAKQVVEAVRNAGDRKEYPDNIYGYGVPDIWKACQIELEKKK